MIVAETGRQVAEAVAEARAAGKAPVALVPTMGALHAGHLSLVEAARNECGYVVVSIFVNPIQFGPGEDFDRYPRTFEADRKACRQAGADAIFAPCAAEMYPPQARTTVRVAGLTEGLCGASRPGHFEGVCTVVAKLFHLVGPDAAYFGAKDFQQTVVIRRMVADLNFPLDIRVCPTVREGDGLAMSSRNAYLSPEERAEATALYAALRQAAEAVRGGQTDAAAVSAGIRAVLAERAPLGRVEYVELVDPCDLSPVVEITAPAVAAVAVKFPSARLIDNMRLEPAD
jgi:pantoate--beta-alanine ligase